MTAPLTYGELMHDARRHVAAATTYVLLTPMPDADSARAVIAARAAVLAAVREQVVSLYGNARLAAVSQDQPLRSRPARNSFIDPRTAQTRRFKQWADLARRLTAAHPPLGDLATGYLPADEYARAARLIRAASDLLDTHRTTTQLTPRTLATDAAILEPLRIAEALTTSHHLYARCREAGMPASDVDRALPLALQQAFADKTLDLALMLPAQPSWLDNVPVAAAIRTDTPPHEWADRLARLPRRLATVAALGPVSIETMKAAASVAMYTHYLQAVDGSVSGPNPWIPIVAELRQWHSPLPPDSVILTDATRLDTLVRAARADLGSDATRRLAAQATASAPALDTLASTANRLLPTADRWIPARPVPGHIKVPHAPPFVAYRPTAVPTLWPTATLPPAPAV